MVKNFDDNMFSRFDIIPACDRETKRRTDGQTCCQGVVGKSRRKSQQYQNYILNNDHFENSNNLGKIVALGTQWKGHT